ncbi:MAG: hypothetical protein ABH881_02265 [bacterium]
MEKKFNFNKAGKIILFVLLYWVIFIILPYFSIYKIEKYSSDFALYIMYYILFFAPLLFFFPCKLIELQTKRGKIILVLLGLILPYLYIYLSIFYMLNNLKIGW